MNSRFITEEEIRNELLRQIELNDDEGASQGTCSEIEDGNLSDLSDDENVFGDSEVIDIDYNYDDHEINFFIGKDNETMWADRPLANRNSRTPSRNLVSHLPGPKGRARELKNEADLFDLFIPDTMIELIVLYTNEEIERQAQNYKSKQYYISKCDIGELKAFFGLLIMSGVLKNSGLTTNDMFSRIFGPPLFRCTMSKNRFEFLLLTLRFDSKVDRQERRIFDKFTAFREIWSMFVSNCREYYTPSEYITIDETLLNFRGRCPFRMYMPMKPDKYGLKVISMCDAKTFYFCGGIPYTGKAERINSNILLPTEYVLNLTEPIAGTNRNVTTDNWYTSYELAHQLQNKKLTLVGTLKKNKREIPLDLINTNRPINSSLFAYDPDVMLVSYIPKKNKNVILLSTMHSTGEINPDTSKPEIIMFYNETKGGVDVFDKLCHAKTTARKTRRWPMRYFFGMIDAAALNAYVIFKLNGCHEDLGQFSRSDFLKNLAFTLIKPYVNKRFSNKFLPKNLRAEMAIFLGKDLRELDNQNIIPSNSLTRPGKCAFCNYKKNRRGTKRCGTCNKSLCAEHTIKEEKLRCQTCNASEQETDLDE